MTITTYFWDELTDNVIMESDDEGNVTTYTHVPELHGKVLSQNRNGDRSYFHYDGEGAVRQVTDSAGNVTDEMTYTAFGETVSKTGSTVNPWGYRGALGYYTNPTTDDLYVRARTLEASLGRWLSEDPIGIEGGINQFVYVTSDPVNKADPSGLQEEKPPKLKTIAALPKSFKCKKCGGFEGSWLYGSLAFEQPVYLVQYMCLKYENTHCASGCPCEPTTMKFKASCCFFEYLGKLPVEGDNWGLQFDTKVCSHKGQATQSSTVSAFKDDPKNTIAWVNPKTTPFMCGGAQIDTSLYLPDTPATHKLLAEWAKKSPRVAKTSLLVSFESSCCPREEGKQGTSVVKAESGGVDMKGVIEQCDP